MAPDSCANFPFRGSLTTWVLFRLENGHWRFWEGLELAAVLVDLGAVIYGMVAVVVEVGGRTMVWAYEQWKKDRAKRDELVREAIRAELQVEERKRLAQWIKDGHTVEEWLAQPGGETTRR